MNPKLTFEASLQSLQIWWEIIFPALLPFLILTEILMALGLLHTMSKSFEPLMTTLFRLPGIAAVIMATGCIAGYPAGAKMTATLRQHHFITRQEGEKLLILSHMTNPIFIIMVIGVGFLQHSPYGWLLLITHLCSVFIMTIILKYIFHSSTTHDNHPTLKQHEVLAFLNANKTLSFGKVLGDAVSNSIQTLMLIGGIMMFFSVMIQMITISFTPAPWTIPWISGALEMHLGAYFTSVNIQHHPVLQLAILSAIVTWSGLSTLMQVRAIISNIDLRFSVFVVFKSIQTIIAFMLMWILYPAFTYLWDQSNTVAVSTQQVIRENFAVPSPFTIACYSLLAFTALLCFMSLSSYLISIFNSKNQ